MNLHQKKISSNINSFISKNKLVDFGAYNGLLLDTNTRFWDKQKWKNPRRWQRKSWIFIGAYSADIFIGFALIDAGYLGKAFCYIYYPKTGELIENGIDKPFAFGADFDAGYKEDWQLGNYKISTTSDGKMSFEYTGKKFQLSLNCQNNENGLSFVCPSHGKNRPFHFTYKNMLLPTSVIIKQKGKKDVGTNLMAAIDYSKGYPPKHTKWNWVSFLGKTNSGTLVGINLVNQFNANMENVLWLGTQKELIGTVDFIYSKPLDKSIWKIRSKNRNLELIMQPDGCRRENINIKILKSKFIQVFGKIKGKIKINEQWQEIEGHGVMEEHEAIW